MQRDLPKAAATFILVMVFLVLVCAVMTDPRAIIVLCGAVYCLFCVTPFAIFLYLLYRSRHDPLWMRLGPLPLNGRWLCYFVSAIVSVPIVAALLLAAAILLLLVLLPGCSP